MGRIPERSTGFPAAASFSWDFPMSRQEKMHRVLLLFEGEVDKGEREITTLRQENEKLRLAVQSLAAVTKTPQQVPHSDHQRSSRLSTGVSAEPSSHQGEHQCGQSVSEAQRVASFIDHTSRSVVVETMRVGRRLECDMDHYLDTALNESAKTIEYVDTALTESVKTMELKGNDVLQAIEEWRPDSSGLAKFAQSQLEEIGGKTQEQAEALRASLWQWGQVITNDQDGTTDISAPTLIPLNDELGGQALKLGEKAQEHIQAFGATFGWWSQDPQNVGK